ncbi:hypothetical protein [Acidithiobacillus ferrivorans]|uniref:hypothetical protein n=1 Tax=Acidithiobacillus ferrivorans TaxID=160808 RepID=UPI00130530D4|nr:hypothetical protein [Acidithiobacillus ferrivorans]
MAPLRRPSVAPYCRSVTPGKRGSAMIGLRHFERTFELHIYGPRVTVYDLGEALADQWQLASESSLRHA